ncbi:MAG: glycosyl hydrolase 53 family protein [Butyrivibrio sp.]|nr:glycosyl hydrolase 53 family protein [Butyrivibrio sp.]
MTKRNYRIFGALMAATMAMGSIYGCGNGAAGSETGTVPATQEETSGNTTTDSAESGTNSAGDSAATEETGKSGDDNDAEQQEKVTPAAPRDKVSSVTPQDGLDLAQDIFIKKIENLPEDFICGMDASSVLVEENSGVKYYDFEGKEADVFKTLSEAGVNYIRLRVWNDPYDEAGHGYGGGNNDVPTAIELGKRATEYGMKVSIDFHYSDFWADPKRQLSPKAWEGMSVKEKSEALYDFTKDSLSQLLDAGVDVGMVQIGNEINYGMSGENSQANVTALLAAGSKAVREISKEFDQEIKILVHYTNIEDVDQVENRVKNLGLAGVDYDIIGLSFYPFWDGNFENMQNVVRMIREGYDKDVLIAETSYCYTSLDGDGSGNSVSGTDDIVEGYPATVQGQANILRDTMAAANEAGALGIFYWEGVWLPVGANTDDNSEIWETYGSGWASSFAGVYDPDDAGLYYGGCSWENQAMFSFAGNPLPSLNVFKYIRTGAEAELKIDAVPDVYLNFVTGDEISLPEKTPVIYNDTSKNTKVPVTWDNDEVSKIDSSKEGKYDITGTVGDGTTLTCHVEVNLPNVVVNPSFEDEDTSMWKISSKGSDPTDFQDKADDAHTGTKALHFWAGDGNVDFEVKQELKDIPAGTYSLQCFAQGGDTSEDSELTLIVVVNGKEYTEPFMVTNWAEWKNPVISDIKIATGDTVTIGVHYISNKGSWGTVDDFILEKTGD